MKYHKIILPVILVSSSIFVLYGLKNDFFTSNTSGNSSDQNSSSGLDQQDGSSSDISYQKLSVISNRCRGCGKCVRIDPQHFEMSENKAIIVSSTNLNSNNLALAINNCPPQAITLE